MNFNTKICVGSILLIILIYCCLGTKSVMEGLAVQGNSEQLFFTVLIVSNFSALFADSAN